MKQKVAIRNDAKQNINSLVDLEQAEKLIKGNAEMIEPEIVQVLKHTSTELDEEDLVDVKPITVETLTRPVHQKPTE